MYDAAGRCRLAPEILRIRTLTMNPRYRSEHQGTFSMHHHTIRWLSALAIACGVLAFPRSASAMASRSMSSSVLGVFGNEATAVAPASDWYSWAVAPSRLAPGEKDGRVVSSEEVEGSVAKGPCPALGCETVGRGTPPERRASRMRGGGSATPMVEPSLIPGPVAWRFATRERCQASRS